MSDEQVKEQTDTQQVEAGRLVVSQWIESRDWVGFTMGDFIKLLVDGGPGDMVFARAQEMSEVDGEGKFILKLEIHLVPNGYVLPHGLEINCHQFHAYLLDLIHRGRVK